jgi:hypothetical protein
MNDRIPRNERDRVLVDVKAKPSGWPMASLDPDSGRGPRATSGIPAHEIPQNQVSTVSGDCRTAANGQGLCEACNHAKQATDWHATPRPGPRSRHTVETVTPTGHTYNSTAPPVAKPTWVEIQPGLWQLAA